MSDKCQQNDASKSQCKKGDDPKHERQHDERNVKHAEHECDKKLSDDCRPEDSDNKSENCDDKNNQACDKNDSGKMTLYYFNTRGRAELIRYILCFAKADFEDVRFNKEEWPNVKTKFPAGQVPVLEVEHCGRTVLLSQSLTIARYLAIRYGLTGSDSIEAAQCDEVVDCLNDLINLAVLAFLEQDSNRREIIRNRLRDQEYPRILGHLEATLEANGGKHIIGKDWTYADLALSVFLCGLKNRGADLERMQTGYPGICELAAAVEEIPQIQAWIQKRPETEM